MTEPTWAIVRTRSRCEDIAAQGFLNAGYRAYVPRYRVLLWPRGASRKPAATMRALFSGLVFVQDWRGWPDRTQNRIAQVIGLVPGMRANEFARISGADVAVLMDRERRGSYEPPEVRRPPANGIVLRDDLEPGDSVGYEWVGLQIEATLDELSPEGAAIIRTWALGREVRLKVDAADLMKISA